MTFTWPALCLRVACLHGSLTDQIDRRTIHRYINIDRELCCTVKKVWCSFRLALIRTAKGTWMDFTWNSVLQFRDVARKKNRAVDAYSGVYSSKPSVKQVSLPVKNLKNYNYSVTLLKQWCQTKHQ